MDKLLKLKDFVFDFPNHLIAQTPLVERDQSKLIVRYFDGKISHKNFFDLASIFKNGGLFVFNDSRVIPSRLIAKQHLQYDQNDQTKRKGIEVFLLEKQGDTWLAIGKPMKKLHPGLEIDFDNQIKGIVISKDVEKDTPTVKIKFNIDNQEFYSWIEKNGYIPLPPYIKRPDPVSAEKSKDKYCYQTLYAKDIGSTAAPTAGFHFSKKVLSDLKTAKVESAFVTLHVGGGTFLPVRSKDLVNHKMHEESYYVPKETIEQIIKAKRDKKPIVAIGTTSFRAIESMFLSCNGCFEKMLELSGQWHRTGLFVYPKKKKERYNSSIFDAIITNFHQPESTLLMLICALIGFDETKELYKEAVSENYRLFSYGDSSLLWLK